MLGVVCELGVPDAIDAGSRTPDEIASSVGAHADALDRVLRFLASRGWFVRRRDGSYRLNARSRALRTNDPESLRDWVRFASADWHWDIWNHAIVPVTEDQSAATAATGRPFFEWVHEQRPDAGATFDAAMHSLSSVAGPLLADAVDIDGVRTVCDVGGGTGRLLRTFLETYPSISGTVFDLDDVVTGAPAVLGVLPAERWRAVGGSFFDAGAIPAGHDRYVMQAIMHDWGDEPAGQILDNVRAAMPDDARLWVVDSVVDPQTLPRTWEEATARNSSIFIADIDDSSPAFGTRYPVYAKFLPTLDCISVIPVPGVVLPPGVRTPPCSPHACTRSTAHRSSPMPSSSASPGYESARLPSSNCTATRSTI